MTAKPEHFARALAESLELEWPFRFVDIVGELGLQIRHVPATGFDGALLRLAGIQKGIVAVRKDISQTSKRFTVAHEIGHYVLPGHEADCSVCTDRDISLSHVKGSHLEKEANTFAAELLLPRSTVSAIVNKRGLSLSTCKFVAQTFDVSLTVAMIRCVELTNRNAAFVETKNGIIGPYRPSPRWKTFIVQGREIGEEALARKLSPEGDREKRGPVREMNWVWDETGRDILTEESMLMPRYNTVLTLLIRDPEED